MLKRRTLDVGGARSVNGVDGVRSGLGGSVRGLGIRESRRLRVLAGEGGELGRTAECLGLGDVNLRVDCLDGDFLFLVFQADAMGWP